ncbi:MAG: polyribonucleotide nucleotidyltransferase [Fuerstiella sp.]
MKKVTVECEFGGRTLSLTSGEMAKQASGAVMIQYGETSVFVAAQTGPSRPGTNFFPLTVDYRERLASAGKFAGGYLKREGRPTTKEILTCRLTDRPLRPLFPKGYREEVQVMSNVMSCDGENNPDVLSITGGSAALRISGMPFKGPIAAVRIGMIDNELIVMPTVQQMAESTLDLIVAGSSKSILMIEGFAEQLPEKEMGDAIMFAHDFIKQLCQLQEDLASQLGVAPPEIPEPAANPFEEKLADAFQKIKDAKATRLKQERDAALSAVKAELLEQHFPDEADETSDGLTRGQFGDAFYKLEAKAVRALILSGTRLDGRGPTDLRGVDCSVSILPRVHGSALFTRGETQSLATITLGSPRDKQRSDGLFGEFSDQFMLHYYFPSFSVGECRPIRGPGRREIGHGCLAERSLASVIPSDEKFPYTIRVISDILESNGSSSMASVCSATLGLMDAGVPILQPVAGISIGIVDEGDKWTLLTDIMGDEDHFGDMDFKVAGTGRGITGIQLDLKNEGISEEIIRATLEQALKARKDLLREMLSAIRRPRASVSESAPKLVQTSINPEKIGLLIGPGGKTIRAIQEESGATIDIAEDGKVTISAENGAAADAALARIEALTEEIQPGRVYTGKVTSVKDFGAFIEIAPGKDGLCHISELSDGFVKNVSEVCKVGDIMEVKVIAVDDQNRVKLSRKAVLVAAGGGDDKGDTEFDDDKD